MSDVVLERGEEQCTLVQKVVIERTRGWASLQLRALWGRWELLYFLVWRDLKVRYKRTVRGVDWALPWKLMLALAVILLICRPGESSALLDLYEEPWSPPVSLSQAVVNATGTPVDALYPVMVADMWGVVHAVWPARFDEQLAAVGDVLMYARWDGSAWSAPVDILYRSEQAFWLPKIAADTEGGLHLAWLVGDSVWYSRARAIDAGSAKAWSVPVEVARGDISGLSIVADQTGAAHVVFCVQSGYENSVVHASSADGKVWTEPSTVGYAAQGVCNSSQAIDDMDRLHVVWAAGYSGMEVNPDAAAFYSRSLNGGRDWLSQVEIDRWNESYGGTYGPAKVNVMAIGSDEVHVVWLGSPGGQRWHQWSEDGGNTWHPAAQMYADFRGLTEPPAMAVDSLGRLHMVSMGWMETDERPFGLFHAYWTGGQWSPLTLVNEQQSLAGIGGGERAALAITGGNTLHAVWDVQAPAQIWASRAVVDAPAVPLEPRPKGSAPAVTTPRAMPTSTAGIVDTSAAEQEAPAAVAREVAAFSDSAPSAGQAGMGILLGVLAAAVLVGVVLLVQLRRQFR